MNITIKQPIRKRGFRMTCKKCGSPLLEDALFCMNCGERIDTSCEQPETVPVEEPINTQTREPQPVPVQTSYQQKIPPQYKPLSPWSYLGLQLLFSIPLIGLIFSVVFSFSDKNINRRNFARSYWCAILIITILMLFWLLCMSLFGLAISLSL